MDELADGWETPMFEKIFFVFIIRLGAVAPQEIFFRAFYQSGGEVTELGFHLLHPTLLQNLFAIEDVVFLTVGQLLLTFTDHQLIVFAWSNNSDFVFTYFWVITRCETTSVLGEERDSQKLSASAEECQHFIDY
jgi:hypothetical protein